MPIVAALDKEIKTASGINTKIFDSKLETCHLDFRANTIYKLTNL